MLEEIILQNPWWKTKIVDKSRLGSIKRNDFKLIKEKLNEKKITCILGPRRTGKTTLIYETINHLLENGVQPEEILYISLDSPKIRLIIKDKFDEILQQYSETIIKKPIDKINNKIYIFLDEVHKLNDWGNIIKYWQDLNINIKFIVSGSSAIRILKGSGESLLGRIHHIVIYPLAFSEFTGKRIAFDILNFEEIKKIYGELILEKQDFLIQLDDYMLRGGYPEIFFEKNLQKAYEALRNYKTLTLTRDILDLKDIKEPRILNDLADLLSDSMSERINYSSFASILKIKVDTVKKYLSYLEECFFIYTTYVYSRKHILSTRKEKKLYFIDNGLRNSLILKEIDDNDKTKIIENIIFTHMLHLKKEEIFPKIFYWLDQQKNEVDLIITIKDKIIPIETKYSNNIPKKEIKGLLNFMDIHTITEGIVVTRDMLSQQKIDGKIIDFIPAWLFLLNTFDTQ